MSSMLNVNFCRKKSATKDIGHPTSCVFARTIIKAHMPSTGGEGKVVTIGVNLYILPVPSCLKENPCYHCEYHSTHKARTCRVAFYLTSVNR